tara:strand:- start:3893 stop:4978 length:1086 start_codon:yes stop_codon:yes gene_type:complete
MNSNNKIFERIPNSTLFFALVSILFIKIIIYILISNDLLNISLGGGSDAGYYDAYAQGVTNVAVNTWPVILRYLNDIGLYSRHSIAFIIFLLHLVAIPIIVSKLSGLSLKNDQKYYFYIILLCSVYPTLFFYAFDIYRDVFMVFSFLIGCLIVKKCLKSTNFLPFILYLSISILVGMFLLGLRPYLGYAFLLSIFLWKIKFTKKRLIFFGSLYFLALFVANYAGFLEALTEYRSEFEEAGGGSTLGLNFSNPIMFIPNFILSTLGQLFGLYITNPLAVLLLLIETLPFFFMLIYIIKNIRLADNFLRFLIIFFVLYGSVWLIGNDNLGTAVRLRLYNYLAIYISFFYILNLKEKALKQYIR